MDKYGRVSTRYMLIFFLIYRSSHKGAAFIKNFEAEADAKPEGVRKSSSFNTFDLWTYQSELSLFLEANPAIPDEEWEIEHVYGYRVSDCQQNLRYNDKGEAVYMVAALGVVMNTETCEQRLYGGK